MVTGSPSEAHDGAIPRSRYNLHCAVPAQVADGQAGRAPLRGAGEFCVPKEIARPAAETNDFSLPVDRQHLRQTVSVDIRDRGRDGDGVGHLVAPNPHTLAVHRDDEASRGPNDEISTAVSIHVADGGGNVNVPRRRHIGPSHLLRVDVGHHEGQHENPPDALHNKFLHFLHISAQ